MQTALSGGRRPTHAAVAGRTLALDEGRTVTRQDLWKALNDAEKALGLRASLRAILKALVGVWGEQETEGHVLVWPSNDYLINVTGLCERSVRNCLRALTDLRLLTARDSGNKKRWVRKDAAGNITIGFGFDLTPLYVRRGEFVAMLAEQKEQRDAQERMHDLISACRRATEELVCELRIAFPDAAIEDIELAMEHQKRLTPRRGSIAPLDEVLEAWQELRLVTEKRFMSVQSLNHAASDGNPCRHKETDNGFSSEACNKGFRKEAESVLQTEPRSSDPSVSLILEACPAVNDYVAGTIQGEAGFIAAGRMLRIAFGAHESAWQEALEGLGPFRAAAAAAYVLQVYTDDLAAGAGRIRNPGGYFRALVRMMGQRKFSLETELLALRRRRMI